MCKNQESNGLEKLIDNSHTNGVFYIFEYFKMRILMRNQFKFTVKEQDVIDLKKRRFVRQMVSAALVRGDLIRPSCCSLCKMERRKIQAHHIDYGKPFDVIWVCTKCHGKAHESSSPLNPLNNPQSPLPGLCHEKCDVNVSVSLPVSNFIALKRLADLKNTSVSLLLKTLIKNAAPVDDGQLCFEFMESNDNTQTIENARIPSLSKNEDVLLQSEGSLLFKLWGQGDKSLQAVG